MQRAIVREADSSDSSRGRLKAIGRSVLAVIAGIVVSGVLISAVEGISSVLFPLPPGLDIHDHEAMRRHVDTLPIGAFLLVLVAWAVSTFGGSWVAARIASRGRMAHGLIVGAIFLLAGVVNMLMIPHPWWMWLGGMVTLVGGSYLGARLASSSRVTT